LETLGLEVRPAWRRQADLRSGREDDLALAPRVGMDDQRQPTAAVACEKTLEAPVVIGVAVRDDDRAQVFDGDAEHVQVSGEPVGRQPAVVENRASSAVRLHSDKR
jgi:hypothetical protein